MISGKKKIFACVDGSIGMVKTTVLKLLSNKYHLRTSKSVPEWFRSYITEVRKLSLEQEYKLYEAAHIAEIMNKTDDRIYIYDRGIYSTIIRIFYKSGKSVNEVLEYIVNLEIVPELALILQCGKDVCYARRDGNIRFDDIFFEYENAVYDSMIKTMDNCRKIDADQEPLLVADDIYRCIEEEFGEII